MPMEPLELKELTGTATRTYGTRKVTSDQRSRPIHVAIALWEERWDSAPHGLIRGWVIVVDQPSQHQVVTSGQTLHADHNPIVLTDLNSVMAKLHISPRDVWVVLGKRRRALGIILEGKGYNVTGTFAQDNRAAARASSLRTRHAKQCAKKARAQGEAPRIKKRHAPVATPTLWLPQSSRSRGQQGSIVISCDASSDTITKGSMCFVADNGDYQLRTRKTKASTNELELETITLALRYITRTQVRKAIIETDSAAALTTINYLLRGGAAQGQRKGISAGARARFQEALHEAQRTAHVEIRSVVGHAGDPLNHAADRIAYMALRATVHSRDKAQPTLNKAIDIAIKKAVAEIDKRKK